MDKTYECPICKTIQIKEGEDNWHVCKNCKAMIEIKEENGIITTKPYKDKVDAIKYFTK